MARRQFTATGVLTNPAKVTVTLDVEPADGNPDQSHCTRFEVSREDGRPVTDRMLRRISVDTLTRQARGRFESSHKLEKRYGKTHMWVPVGSIEASEIYKRYAEGARKPLRGSPIPDGFLEAVAEVYRKAVDQQDPAPSKVVADTFDGGVSTAKRWVALARRRGFLGPATRGRASV